MITSINNEVVLSLTKLHKSKYRQIEKLYIVEGRHLVSEALSLNIVKEIYTTDKFTNGILVSDNVMRKICNTSTIVDIIAVCKMQETNNEITDKVLILDQIQDPGNMGALMRSAKAFGFDTFFLCDGCVDIYNDKVIRSSQGAIFKLNFLKGDKISFINKLKETHAVFSTNVVNGKNVKDVNKTNKVGLILGNEGNGVSNEINELALNNLYIDILSTESLNVVVAGSILMYELGE